MFVILHFKISRFSEIARGLDYLLKRQNLCEHMKNVWMQRTTQRRIKLLDLSVAGSLVKELLVTHAYQLIHPGAVISDRPVRTNFEVRGANIYQWPGPFPQGSEGGILPREDFEI